MSYVNRTAYRSLVEQASSRRRLIINACSIIFFFFIHVDDAKNFNSAVVSELELYTRRVETAAKNRS